MAKVPLLRSVLKWTDKINFEVNQDACAVLLSPPAFIQKPQKPLWVIPSRSASHTFSLKSQEAFPEQTAFNTVEHPSPVT